MTRRVIPSTVARVASTSATDAFRVPAGARGFQLSPRTTSVDVRWGLTPEDARSANNSALLAAGQGYELVLAGEDQFDEFELFFYAASNITVDCVWW